MASIRSVLQPALCTTALLLAGTLASAQEPTLEPSGVRGNLGTNLSGDTIVRYDLETDSIIVITDEETNAQIASLIETLDRPVPQVLIKVLFLEVTHTDDLDLGVEASYSFDAGTDSLLTDFGVASASRGGFLKIIEDDLSVTLRALAGQGKLEVLSRPSVIARNNELATITIGQEVPFIRNSRVTDSGQTINTIEYEDIGIILEVTPHITPDRLVEMEVAPEISTLTSESVAITDTTDARVIAKRSASTRVVVADGKTVVIGGLMEDNMTESVSKVPLLGDIPLVGALFRRTIKEKSKTELLIFLTPTVVTGVEDLETLTDSERAQFDIVPTAFDGVDMPDYLPPLPED
ncbi:MAG: ral secretion pathway protein [Candidatus Sumerlaeota bacterium]|nr:ral secretion pathway protein [Candidatus Sumerlaeota bacterium]